MGSLHSEASHFFAPEKMKNCRLRRKENNPSGLFLGAGVSRSRPANSVRFSRAKQSEKRVESSRARQENRLRFCEVFFLLPEKILTNRFDGQKHSRLARLERVAILLVSSCSTASLVLPQAARGCEPGAPKSHRNAVAFSFISYSAALMASTSGSSAVSASPFSPAARMPLSAGSAAMILSEFRMVSRIMASWAASTLFRTM